MVDYEFVIDARPRGGGYKRRSKITSIYGPFRFSARSKFLSTFAAHRPFSYTRFLAHFGRRFHTSKRHFQGTYSISFSLFFGFEDTTSA